MSFAGNINIYFGFGAFIFINPWPNIKFSEKLMDLRILDSMKMLLLELQRTLKSRG